MRKKNIGVYFYFLVAVTNEKKNNNEKKKFVVESIGLLPNCIVKKKNCIARLKLYCKRR